MEENKKLEGLEIISVGIDVSKAKLDVALLKSDRGHIAARFENNSGGIARLIVLLKQQRTGQTVPCVVESTGDYHLLSALMITKEGFRVNCINPLITKKYQRASIRGTKTDAVDALRLAEIGLLENNLGHMEFNHGNRISQITSPPEKDEKPGLLRRGRQSENSLILR